MPLTFYTVVCEKPGYPVKYIKPLHQSEYTTYGRVQTFADRACPFHDPGDACGEFEAWLGHDKVCYLDEKQFQLKVRAMHLLRRETEKKLKAWNVMVAKKSDNEEAFTPALSVDLNRETPN